MVIGKIGVYGVIVVKMQKARWPKLDWSQSKAFLSRADADAYYRDQVKGEPAARLVYLVRVYAIGYELIDWYVGGFSRLVAAKPGEPLFPGVSAGVDEIRAEVGSWKESDHIPFTPSPWEELVLNTERIAADVFQEATKNPTAQAYMIGDGLPPGDEPIAYTAFASMSHGDVAGPTVHQGLVKEWNCLGWDQESAESTGEGVIVAVLDTGVNVGAAELKGRCLPLIDATGTDPAGRDKNGHGHFCATEIAGVDLAKGFIGLTAKAVILPVRVLTAAGWGTDTMISRGVDAAVRAGAKVISMSLGGPGEMPLTHAAFKRALAAGVTIVVAAGNEGPGNNTVGYPGSYEEAISVGAVSADGVLGSFSSRGKPLDVCGVGVAKLGITTGGTVQGWNGTSMACPTVAAAVAAYYELHQELHPNTPVDPRKVLLALVGTSKDIGTPGRDDATGFGIVQFGDLLGTIQVPPPVPPPPVNPAVYTFHPGDTAEAFADTLGRLITRIRITFPEGEPVTFIEKAA